MMNLFKQTKLFFFVGVLLGIVTPVVGYGEILFEENFDGQPNWTSTMHTTSQSQKAIEGNVLPQNWDAIYQGTEWSPETGYPSNHASLEILGTNANKARGAKGKSAVFWRESHSRGWNNWASDAQLVKLLDQGATQLYVEFWIRFSDDWFGRKSGEYGSWTSKIFRVGSWDKAGDLFNGAVGGIGPVFFWDWKRDAYGVRNVNTFRGGPHGENYNMLDANGNRIYTSGESLNYIQSTFGMGEGGEDPLLPDRVNGGYLKDFRGIVDHDQVFGRGGSWTKVAFYLRMNSAVDVRDGVVRQWINGVQILNLTDVPWISTNADNKMVKWNYVAIGGNDFFQAYPNDQRYEDWYSIDDLVIRDSIPTELDVEEALSPPSPPPTVIVE